MLTFIPRRHQSDSFARVCVHVAAHPLLVALFFLPCTTFIVRRYQSIVAPSSSPLFSARRPSFLVNFALSGRSLSAVAGSVQIRWFRGCPCHNFLSPGIGTFFIMSDEGIFPSYSARFQNRMVKSSVWFPVGAIIFCLAGGSRVCE